MGPRSTAAHKHVRGSLVGIRIDGLAVGPDHRRVSAHRNGKAELIVRRAIGGSQLLLLAPRRPALHKHVRGSLLGILVVSPDHRRVPAYRYGVTEIVGRRAVGSSQLLLLGPYSGAPHKHVRGSLLEMVLVSPNHRRVSAYRNGVAETVALRAIGGSQLLLLGPHSTAAHKHVRGSLSVTLVISPDHHRVPAHRHGGAELIAHRAIGSGQLLLLAPHSSAAHKHVRGSLAGVRIDSLEKSSDHRRVAAHRNRVAEVVVRRAIGSSQLLLLRPGRVHYQWILSALVLDDQPDLTTPHLQPRRKNAPACVQGPQARIVQHDALARFEERRAIICLLGWPQFSAHAKGNYQRLAGAVRSRALSERKALLQSLRFVQVPLGEISPLVLHAVAPTGQCGGRGLLEPIAVTISGQMEAHAAVRMTQPGFPVVELKRQPLCGVCATPGPMAGILQRVRRALEGLPQPFVRSGLLPDRIRVGGSRAAVELQLRQAQAREQNQPYAYVRECSSANHGTSLLSARAGPLSCHRSRR